MIERAPGEGPAQVLWPESETEDMASKKSGICESSWSVESWRMALPVPVAMRVAEK